MASSGEAACLKRYDPQQLIKGMYAGFVEVRNYVKGSEVVQSMDHNNKNENFRVKVHNEKMTEYELQGWLPLILASLNRMSPPIPGLDQPVPP